MSKNKKIWKCGCGEENPLKNKDCGCCGEPMVGKSIKVKQNKFRQELQRKTGLRGMSCTKNY